MADRRTDTTETTAQPAADRPAPGKPPRGSGRGGSTAEPGERPSGAERVAAAVSKARGGKQEPARAGSTDRGEATRSGARPAKPARRVRRARLRLTHVDPWSVMKTAFLLSIAVGIVMVVAVGIVWSVLGAAGVWDSIDSAVADVAGDSGEGFAIEDYLGTSRVMGVTMLLAVVDVFLITVVATLGAFLYNLAAALLGGLEVVFAEEDR